MEFLGLYNYKQVLLDSGFCFCFLISGRVFESSAKSWDNSAVFPLFSVKSPASHVG